MATEVLVVLVTFPGTADVRAITRTIVEEKLAACGSIVPQVESIYRWNDKVESAGETLVIFKTNIGSYDALESRLRALHPYEVPEIIAMQVHAGNANYIAWVTANCTG